MADQSAFPTSLDSVPTDRAASGVIPSSDWNTYLDAVRNIEVKVGVDSSIVTGSLDYKVSNIIRFLTPAVTAASWTACADWTDVDISSLTSTDTAKVAIISVDLSFTPGAGPTRMTALFRKNGDTEEVVLPKLYAQDYDGTARCAGMYIIPCDGSEIFETKLQVDASTPTSIVFKVNLVGYIV